jgi:Putative peptidoglycan binding domain
VDYGPDPDDWFGDQDPEERRMPDVPADESVAPRADDWLNEAGDTQLRPPWAQTIDRRMVTVGASLLVLLIAVLAAAGVFSGSRANAPTTTPSRTPTQTTTAAATATTARQLPAPPTTLKPGDTGTEVAILQRALASLGFSSGKADGQYGPATKNAVARFQQSTGLVADGILGPATLRALANALRGP